MGSDTDFTATGPTFAGFFTDLGADGKPTMAFGGLATGETIGLLGFANTLGPNQQNTYSFRAGVEGSSDDSTGVAGVSLRHPGVFGQVEDSPLVPNGWLAGVLGVASTQPGVIGYARDGDGTQGLSFTGTAVRAVSFFGPGVQSISGALTGVIGTSELDTGVRGVSGTQGPTPVAGLPTIAGVLGTSDAQAGVIGTSNRTAGVLGFSNNVGVYGEGANFAGIFRGNVLITGDLTLQDATVAAKIKSAIVPFPDGSKRVLHCMESPEHWFEDFGAAKLKRGRAMVKLDADFAKVIKRGDYKVFLAPEGDCRGLYVRKSAASFEVRELMGGTSSIAFSYRIVGLRKDIRAHKRFAKIDTRLPLPAAAKRPPRTPKPTPAALRAFIARLEQEARDRAPKRPRKVGRARAATRWSRQVAARGAKR
jgi:hypothetical protein